MQFSNIISIAVTSLAMYGFPSVVADSGAKSDYTYTAGPSGPENWGKLWPACAGKFQSPINFNEKYRLPNENIKMAGPTLLSGYESIANVSVHEKNLNVEFGTAGSGFKQVDGETYLFKSAHVHCPSEHRIDGVRKFNYLSYFFCSCLIIFFILK